MTRTHCWLTLLALLTLGALPAQDDERGRRDAAVRQTLQAFWLASTRCDAEAFRRQIDLPLTLLEPGQGERAGMVRFIVTEQNWPEFRRSLGHAPLPADQVEVQIERLRLEWLGDHTCLLVYDLACKAGQQVTGGHLMSVITWVDGWRVVVSTVPG